jgi:hypothetical protein
MKFKINSLGYTSQLENNFDYNYHQKYIGRIGDEIPHYYKRGKFINAICLCVDYDERGKPFDVDWFSVKDLELV